MRIVGMVVVFVLACWVNLALVSPSVLADVVTYDSEANWQAAAGNQSSFGFEGFNGVVSNQHAGVTFSSFDQGTPKTASGYARTGSNSMISAASVTHGGKGWTATFDSDVGGVAFWTHGLQWSGSQRGSFITLLDASSNVLGTYDLYLTGGGHDPSGSGYGFNGFVSTGTDIHSIDVDIFDGDAVRHDDFQFGTAGSTIPLPPAALMGIGLLGGLALLRRVRKRKA